LLLRKPNLTRNEINFFVPPPHRSEPSLDIQPLFLSALPSNNSEKGPRRFGASSVSICFVIDVFVCKKYY
jgi:hypothetical protein